MNPTSPPSSFSNQPSEATVCSPALPCGATMTTFNGIAAYSNGVDQCTQYACNTPPNTKPGTYGQEYVCTELVDRYYNQTYHIPVTNWKVVANQYCTDHPQGVYVAAIPAQEPQPGDIWVKSAGTEGHVAIVMEYLGNYETIGPAVYVIEQNANITGTGIYPVFSPHVGCFLTANYSHSCNEVQPNNPNCGLFTAAPITGPTFHPTSLSPTSGPTTITPSYYPTTYKPTSPSTNSTTHVKAHAVKFSDGTTVIIYVSIFVGIVLMAGLIYYLYFNFIKNRMFSLDPYRQKDSEATVVNALL